MIKNILFDLGGVIMTIDQPQAVRRFKEIGLSDAETRLDPYTQKGIFGELEEGKIGAETFRLELSKMIGREVTHDECLYAWRGYCKEVPPRNLKALRQLRSEGYRLILLSNTNPYMMEWAMSSSFDGMGNSIDSYFDMSFRSYECGMMKPACAGQVGHRSRRDALPRRRQGQRGVCCRTRDKAVPHFERRRLDK